MNPELPHLLAARLDEPLPGPVVQSKFQPTPRIGRNYDDPTDDARPAAVLILLYPRAGAWHVPLTLRPEHLAAHAGQVSLPGGAVEPGETAAQAAVREFHEELGAEAARVELLGHLSPLFVEASNFLIEPWVGWVGDGPEFEPNPDEVAEVLEMPLVHLLDPGNLESHQRSKRGYCYTAPHFCWSSHQIWGATCMILGEFITLLDRMGAEV
jgi:8-oxo-dGTP pyrophosphatase MutT (NUDIX family)